MLHVHARLNASDRSALQGLKRTTGLSESDLVRRGLQRLQAEAGRRQGAQGLASEGVGRFSKGPRDLSASDRHLDGFGG